MNADKSMVLRALSEGLRPAELQHYTRSGTLQLAAPPPLSLYVHLPWCLKKCPYCDFNSHAQKAQDIPEQAYVAALLADLESSLPLIWGRSIQSVFIGGGTPSLFSAQAIDQLLAGLRARLTMVGDCEVTMEANPGTFEAERFRGFRQAGVTRLSLGVQSFNNQHLQVLGRVHDSAQALAAAQAVSGLFDTFNLDLMYALPGQTLEALRSDVAAALAIGPTHLSIYQLTIEPNTFFAKYPPEPVDEDLVADMLDLIIDMTGQSGLERYEISAFAKPGHRCRHNLNYWQFGDYLGIGAGAHSKLSFAHRVVRQVRLREPQRYMQAALRGHALASDEEVARRELPFEFMLNALRLRDGVPLNLFSERTGLPPSAIEAGVLKGQSAGLLERLDGRIQASAKGFDFLNDAQALFLPA